MGRESAYRRGMFAESVAALYLRAKGYRILKRRYKTAVGEVDLIALRGRTLCCIEVKTRRDIETGLYAVRPQAVARIRRAAEWFLKNHTEYAENYDIRFDVMAIAPYHLIRHIKNAF